MKMIKHVMIVGLCASISLFAVAETKNVTIPLVPVSVIQGKTTPKQLKKEMLETKEELKPVSIKMSPGINEIVVISQGHLNRIVTPFNEPKVVTVSDADIVKRDNVIYLSTDSSTPVTLFITQKESETQALSLTLVPKRIPPQEIFLNMTGMGQGSPVSLGSAPGASGSADFGAFAYSHNIVNKKAERWERKHTYVETIKKVMVNLAKREVPQGYTMSRLSSAKTLPVPQCQQAGVTFDWSNAQALFGHRLNITVGIAKNTSNREIELMANPCFDIAAFSAWPEVYLKPGEATEIYVVRRQNEVLRATTPRPSLLNR